MFFIKRRNATSGRARGWLGARVVEEYDATCLVPPVWAARLDAFGNIEIRLG
jgi:hypothetical protein